MDNKLKCTNMTHRLTFLFLFLVGIIGSGYGQTQIKSMVHDGETRSYRLHIPD